MWLPFDTLRRRAGRHRSGSARRARWWWRWQGHLGFDWGRLFGRHWFGRRLGLSLLRRRRFCRHCFRFYWLGRELDDIAWVESVVRRFFDAQGEFGCVVCYGRGRRFGSSGGAQRGQAEDGDLVDRGPFHHAIPPDQGVRRDATFTNAEHYVGGGHLGYLGIVNANPPLVPATRSIARGALVFLRDGLGRTAGRRIPVRIDQVGATRDHLLAQKG
jgi:hypothetical protein